MGFGGKNGKAAGRHGRPWARPLTDKATRPQRRIRRAAWANGIAKLVRDYQESIAPVPCTRCYAIPDGDGLCILRCSLGPGHDGWHKDSNGARWREDGEGVTVRPRAYAGHITAVVRWKP